MPENFPEYGERAEYGPDDVCYRHPDRHTFTLCNRCGRSICEACQVPTPVGLICPECAREASAKQKAQTVRSGSRFSADQPLVTYSIMGLSLLVYLGQVLFTPVTHALWYAPVYSLPENFEPWRMVTAMFTHSPSSIFHILFNLYALWLFGRNLESIIGRTYFILLYLFSGIGGSAAVLLWGYTGIDAILTPTVGASGAIFGILGATLIVMREANLNANSLLVLIGINVAIGFIPGINISWQAHAGGLIVGALTMYVLVRNRGPRNKKRLQLFLALIFLALVVLAMAFFILPPSLA